MIVQFQLDGERVGVHLSVMSFLLLAHAVSSNLEISVVETMNVRQKL